MREARIVEVMKKGPDWCAKEIAELRKDRARLDWLELNEPSIARINPEHLVPAVVISPRGGKVATLDIRRGSSYRAAIDAAMEADSK